MTEYTHEEWIAEAKRRFGDDAKTWRFVCPSCGHVASVADYQAAGAPESAVAFSCVGRWAGAKKDVFAKDGGPCNYAGGGFFRLNPNTVAFGGAVHSVFAFAEPTREEAANA